MQRNDRTRATAAPARSGQGDRRRVFIGRVTECAPGVRPAGHGRGVAHLKVAKDSCANEKNRIRLERTNRHEMKSHPQ